MRALSQGARALSASGHAAAMAAVVGGGDNTVVVKIPKKKSSSAATTITTAAAIAASTPPPVQDRKMKRVVVSSSDDDEDTIDVEDVQRERAYAQAEEHTKWRLAPPPAKKAKYTPPVLATPARVLAELDPANPWVAAANQMFATAAAAAPAAEAVYVALLPTSPKKAAADRESPNEEPKAPTRVLVRDKKTGKLTGKIDNVVKREKRRTMGPNRNMVLRKVQVDIYQKNANPSSGRRLVHVKTVRWNLMHDDRADAR